MTQGLHNGDDERQFSLLDEYVERLHRGESPNRERLLAEYPELASALYCLDAVEGFLPLPPPASLPQAATPPSPPPLPATADLADRATLLGSAAAPPPLPEGGRPGDSIDLRAAFGEYDLIGELGRGGMGVVYRARQRSLDRLVALKMILASHLASDEQVRRFQAEARAAAGVSHPNIVRVFEVGQVHGQHYFTMQHVAGQSLADRLAAGPLEPDEAVRLLTAIARAVQHLHAHGIVHRDLKPSNILLDEEGRPYVTDFGLAKMFVADSHQTTTGLIAGTPSYMSPEQAAGKRDVGPLADVYSLGAVLFELLTGRPPFLNDNPLDTLLQVLEREPPAPRHLNPRVPPALELVVLKCLDKTPGNRYVSAGALADELERYQAGEALQVQPPGPVERAWLWMQRSPALAVRLAAAAVFYSLELFNYFAFESLKPGVLLFLTAVMSVWLASSYGCQRLLARPEWAIPVRFVWAALDALALTLMLLAAHGAASALVVGYVLLVAASGLWSHQRLVWFMTAVCGVCYGVLVVDFYLLRPELQQGFEVGYMRHADFLVALLLVGAITAQQVSRMRALSRYYERGKRG